MASLENRLSQNVTGEFYVDDSCIDCDTCRQLAPGVFSRYSTAEKSFVTRQPSSREESGRALMSLVACPTSSIGTLHRSNARAAALRFPEHLAGDVYYCGFTSELSFGASSYLIRRPGGNWMIDSPRAAGPLLKRISEWGGLRRMFLTHQDDVADHRIFAQRFGCQRVIHRTEAAGPLAEVELQLGFSESNDPLSLDDGLLAIPLPGHTRGSVAYLYQDEFLFSGDHLWWSPSVGALHASRRHCWYDWRKQIQSMERLLTFDFRWVLPGHGRRYQAPSAPVMREELEELVRRMKQ